jgi:hypothetical protein
MTRNTRITLTIGSWVAGLALSGCAFALALMPGLRLLAIPAGMLALGAWAFGGMRPFLALVVNGSLWDYPIGDWKMSRDAEAERRTTEGDQRNG